MGDQVAKAPPANPLVFELRRIGDVEVGTSPLTLLDVFAAFSLVGQRAAEPDGSPVDSNRMVNIAYHDGHAMLEEREKWLAYAAWLAGKKGSSND